MTSHKTGTREEWLAARLELLEAEKELTRRGDEVARRRQELPWVRVDKDYRFETDEGTASLADLFQGRSQLLVYHFMFGPDYTAGCPSCSAIADGFNGSAVHLANHDVTLCAVSRAPLAKLHAYKRRMGWSFPWASSYGSDFNFDFGAAHTKEEWEAGTVAYNFGDEDLRPAAGEEGSLDAFSQSIVGTDWETYRREGPGMSAFALEDGTVYHTYSTYARGLDVLWGMYQWLDRAPLGRNENRLLVAPPRRVRQPVSDAGLVDPAYCGHGGVEGRGAAEPEFAARVRRLFDSGRHKTIATLRADGSPRISGIECEFADGELRFGSMPGARKGADLRRNPRFALHGQAFRRGGRGGGCRARRRSPGGQFSPGRSGTGLVETCSSPVLSEVVITRLNPEATLLVIETWTPQRGLTSRTRMMRARSRALPIRFLEARRGPPGWPDAATRAFLQVREDRHRPARTIDRTSSSWHRRARDTPRKGRMAIPGRRRRHAGAISRRPANGPVPASSWSTARGPAVGMWI